MKKVILITGLSGSGKTTIAEAIRSRLGSDKVMLVDGDSVRKEGSKDLGFSRQDRFTHLQRMAEIARRSRAEIAIVASIAPFEDARFEFLKRVGADKDCILIYNKTSLELCESRDPKGLYALARDGIIPNFTGISDPYEIPQKADLEIDTSHKSPTELADEMIDLLNL